MESWLADNLIRRARRLGWYLLITDQRLAAVSPSTTPRTGSKTVAGHAEPVRAAAVAAMASLSSFGHGAITDARWPKPLNFENFEGKETQSEKRTSLVYVPYVFPIPRVHVLN